MVSLLYFGGFDRNCVIYILIKMYKKMYDYCRNINFRGVTISWFCLLKFIWGFTFVVSSNVSGIIWRLNFRGAFNFVDIFFPRYKRNFKILHKNFCFYSIYLPQGTSSLFFNRPSYIVFDPSSVHLSVTVRQLCWFSSGSSNNFNYIGLYPLIF